MSRCFDFSNIEGLRRLPLIDRVGRPDARCAMPLRSTADPVQPDHIGGMLDQLQDAQIRDTGRIGFVRSMRG